MAGAGGAAGRRTRACARASTSTTTGPLGLGIVNLIPELGGKSASNSYSLQAGYTVGYHRITSIFNVQLEPQQQPHHQLLHQHRRTIPAAIAGVAVPNNVPLNYGVPGISLSNGIQGLSETQPSFSISQTISFSEVLSWIHGKHNMRFGGDYRRVHRDFLAGSNATGNFAFTGLFTEAMSAAAVPGTGSSIADFLLGLPQSTTLNSSLAKSYLRDNVYDAYAMDDWRMLPSLTLNYGVRWEFFAPYTEKYGHLAEVATNPAGGFTSETEAQAAGRADCPLRSSIHGTRHLRRAWGSRGACRRSSRLWFAPASA